jgi:hypothetical protein
MSKTPPSPSLLDLMRDFMVRKEEQLGEELGEKYGVPPEEVADVVLSFLKDAYGPAMALMEELAAKSGPLLLFIGKKDCAVCSRCKPIIEDFLLEHPELEMVAIDYSQPQGLLYHIIVNQESGMLPLIAFILQGQLRLSFTGECSALSDYERCYSDILSECSQNIYAN